MISRKKFKTKFRKNNLFNWDLVQNAKENLQWIEFKSMLKFVKEKVVKEYLIRIIKKLNKKSSKIFKKVNTK